MFDENKEHTGRVVWFDNRLGMGFIKPDDSSASNEKDVFVHFTDIKGMENQYKYLGAGQLVRFRLIPELVKGKPRAKEVWRI